MSSMQWRASSFGSEVFRYRAGMMTSVSTSSPYFQALPFSTIGFPPLSAFSHPLFPSAPTGEPARVLSQVKKAGTVLASLSRFIHPSSWTAVPLLAHQVLSQVKKAGTVLASLSRFIHPSSWTAVPLLAHQVLSQDRPYSSSGPPIRPRTAEAAAPAGVGGEDSPPGGP